VKPQFRILIKAADDILMTKCL